jgi:8-oxo-dGTP pyrophosphatase MutT (NUDIX family)
MIQENCTVNNEFTTIPETNIKNNERDLSSLTTNKYRPRNDGSKYGGIIQSATGKYLMVKGKESQKWGFAKGHLEEGETPLECVCREVIEETGITILPNPIKCMRLPVATYYLFWFPYEEIPKPRDVNEIDEAKWITALEAKELSMNIDAVSYFKKIW